MYNQISLRLADRGHCAWIYIYSCLCLSVPPCTMPKIKYYLDDLLVCVSLFVNVSFHMRDWAELVMIPTSKTQGPSTLLPTYEFTVQFTVRVSDMFLLLLLLEVNWQSHLLKAIFERRPLFHAVSALIGWQHATERASLGTQKALWIQALYDDLFF